MRRGKSTFLQSSLPVLATYGLFLLISILITALIFVLMHHDNAFHIGGKRLSEVSDTMLAIIGIPATFAAAAVSVLIAKAAYAVSSKQAEIQQSEFLRDNVKSFDSAFSEYVFAFTKLSRRGQKLLRVFVDNNYHANDCRGSMNQEIFEFRTAIEHLEDALIKLSTNSIARSCIDEKMVERAEAGRSLIYLGCPQHFLNNDEFTETDRCAAVTLRASISHTLAMLSHRSAGIDAQGVDTAWIQRLEKRYARNHSRPPRESERTVAIGELGRYMSNDIFVGALFASDILSYEQAVDEKSAFHTEPVYLNPLLWLLEIFACVPGREDIIELWGVDEGLLSSGSMELLNLKSAIPLWMHDALRDLEAKIPNEVGALFDGVWHDPDFDADENTDHNDPRIWVPRYVGRNWCGEGHEELDELLA